MVQAVQLEMEIIFKAEPATSAILGIEITRIGIPVLTQNVGIPVCLQAEMNVGSHEPVSEVTAFRLQHGRRITVETVDEVFIVPEHHLVM
jgi:hypothetical protein